MLSNVCTLHSHYEDISVTTDFQHMHRQDTSELLRHKIFLSVGHDEYWSGPQRIKVTEYIKQTRILMILG